MARMLSDVKEPINILYYGDGGTGKTTHLASMANQGRILFVNAEAGIKSQPLKAHGIDTSEIELWPDPGEGVTYKGLTDLGLRLREQLAADPDAYVGVVWDSVTEIYQALLTTITAEAVERAHRVGKERDPNLITLDDYGVMTQQMRTLARLFRDLPCHFGMSALSKREQDDDGAVVYQPAITAKLQNDLVGWVDVVCVTSVAVVNEEEQFRGLFRPHNKFRGKDRLGVLPKWLVDPTFERIHLYASKELTRDDDPVMLAAQEAAEKQLDRPDAPAGGDDPA